MVPQAGPGPGDGQSETGDSPVSLGDSLAWYSPRFLDSSGNLSTITDGNDHVFTYYYNTKNEVTWFSDHANNKVHLSRDSVGRLTKVEGGLLGGYEPTEFFYDAATSACTKVRYNVGDDDYDAVYEYDQVMRVTKMTDWIDPTYGIRYAYDDANRLSTITDYDDSVLAYGYDAANRVTSVNDYHGNTTTYAYNVVGALTSMTAPGSKTWTYGYDGYGVLTQLSYPDGDDPNIDTKFGYDSQGRMTSLRHYDGATIADGWVYRLDDVGAITRMTSDVSGDGYWDYAYDDRYRLTQAQRKTDGGSLVDQFTYTYDAGDNMVSKAVYDAGTSTTDTTTYTCNDANEMTVLVNGGTTDRRTDRLEIDAIPQCKSHEVAQQLPSCPQGCQVSLPRPSR
ncbi:MAG: RHS repeat protein [bacterium]|nr:RHS repeat protein [bacterium]